MTSQLMGDVSDAQDSCSRGGVLEGVGGRGPHVIKTIDNATTDVERVALTLGPAATSR